MLGSLSSYIEVVCLIDVLELTVGLTNYIAGKNQYADSVVAKFGSRCRDG